MRSSEPWHPFALVGKAKASGSHVLPQNAREVQPIQFFRKLAQVVRSGQGPADLFRRVASRIESAAWKPRIEGLFARISTKLYIGIGAAVALTFIASLGHIQVVKNVLKTCILAVKKVPTIGHCKNL